MPIVPKELEGISPGVFRVSIGTMRCRLQSRASRVFSFVLARADFRAPGQTSTSYQRVRAP
eukprot:11165815-Lingulodinium_polyedra.AAC.1